MILGSTDSTNVLLDLTITNPSGEIIKRVETFSDKFGVFKIDNFRIPADAKVGIWKIDAKSGSNFSVSEFTVLGSNQGMVLNSNKDVYSTSEIVTFTGSGVKAGATVTFKIFNSLGEMIDELNINSKANGEFTTIWKFPDDSIPGEYEIIVDDGLRNTSMKFTLN